MISTRGSGATVAVSAFALCSRGHADDPRVARPGSSAIPVSRLAARAVPRCLRATTGDSHAGHGDHRTLALLVWQSLFPGRRDYLALAGLPVRSRQIFLARFGLRRRWSGGHGHSVVGVLRPRTWEAAADPSSANAATCLGCISVFFAIVALQGLLINLLPARLFTRLSTLAQGGGRRSFCWRPVSWSSATGRPKRIDAAAVVWRHGRRRSGSSGCNEYLLATAIHSSPPWPDARMATAAIG